MIGKLGKILMIDDDEAFLSLVEVFLEEKYDLITANSVKDALEYVNNETVPDLIILDISMPDMNGWEMFNIIKSISFLKDIPIAFLTSIDEQDEISHAHEIGAVDYIVKPCDKTNLLKRIQDIIGKD